MPGFKNVNGFVWPEQDTECAAVTFSWLSDVHEAISRCKEKRVAVQAGGNTGVWPKEIAKFFGSVLTFEPEADNFHCLVANCDEPNIFKFQAALGGGPGSVSMAGDRNNCGAYYVKPGGDIPILCVDNLFLTHCDLIQFDLEGYDYFALCGAEKTIIEHSPVIMVEDKGLSEKYGVKKGELIDYIKRLGYRVAAEPHRDFVLIKE